MKFHPLLCTLSAENQRNMQFFAEDNSHIMTTTRQPLGQIRRFLPWGRSMRKQMHLLAIKCKIFTRRYEIRRYVSKAKQLSPSAYKPTNRPLAKWLTTRLVTPCRMLFHLCVWIKLSLATTCVGLWCQMVPRRGPYLILVLINKYK